MKALTTTTSISRFSGGCYYLSSTVNPFLYSLLSKRFRRGFHDVLRYACRRMDISWFSGHKRSPESREGQRDSMDSSIRQPKRLSSTRKSLRSKPLTGLPHPHTGGGVGGVASSGGVAANYHATANGDSIPGPYGGGVAESSVGSGSRKYKLLFVSNRRAQSITGGGDNNSISNGSFGAQASKSCPPQIVSECDVIPLKEAVAIDFSEAGNPAAAHGMGPGGGVGGPQHLRSKSWRRYCKRTSSGSIVLETCA